MTKSLLWLLVSSLITAYSLYYYETYMVEQASVIIVEFARETFHSILTDKELSKFSIVINNIIIALLFIAKAFVALLGPVIANGVFGMGFKTEFGPEELKT